MAIAGKKIMAEEQEVIIMSDAESLILEIIPELNGEESAKIARCIDTTKTIEEIISDALFMVV